MPFATAGEDRTKLPVGNRHRNARLETFELSSTFSKWLKPPLDASKWNIGQSVRTVKNAFAPSPEVSPVALIVWPPGGAEAGIVTRVTNRPPGPVTARRSWFPSKVMSMVSVGPKPSPVTMERVVGGLTLGASVIVAVAGIAPADGPMLTVRPKMARLTTAGT